MFFVLYPPPPLFGECLFCDTILVLVLDQNRTIVPKSNGRWPKEVWGERERERGKGSRERQEQWVLDRGRKLIKFHYILHLFLMKTHCLSIVFTGVKPIIFWQPRIPFLFQHFPSSFEQLLFFVANFFSLFQVFQRAKKGSIFEDWNKQRTPKHNTNLTFNNTNNVSNYVWKFSVIFFHFPGVK